MTPISPAARAVLAAYRTQLEANLGQRLVQLKLFGSYARGQARPDSDIDVVVVIDRLERASDRTLPMELAGDLIAEHRLVITPIVLSVSELEFLREREDLLAENIDREGIAI